MNTRPFALIALLVLVGCEPPAAGVATGSAPPPPPAPPVPSAGVGFAEEPVAAEVPAQPPADDPSPQIAPQPQPAADIIQPTSSPQPASPQLRINLSAGVAVPQLLPDGTHIGVSVDYKVAGQLHQSASYVLVIDSSAGEIVLPVKLLPQGGTIQGFLNPSVRPEHKPFNAHIAEVLPGSRSRTKVSGTAPLQTSY